MYRYSVRYAFCLVEIRKQANSANRTVIKATIVSYVNKNIFCFTLVSLLCYELVNWKLTQPPSPLTTGQEFNFYVVLKLDTFPSHQGHICC